MGRKLLLEHINVPGINTFDVYRKQGGYASVEKALKTLGAEAVEAQAGGAVLHELDRMDRGLPGRGRCQRAGGLDLRVRRPRGAVVVAVGGVGGADVDIDGKPVFGQGLIQWLPLRGAQIRQAADKIGAHLILVNLAPRMRRMLSPLIFAPEFLSDDLDHALERCETILIEEHLTDRAAGRDLVAWLGQALGSAEHADELARVCERIDVTCIGAGRDRHLRRRQAHGRYRACPAG